MHHFFLKDQTGDNLVVQGQACRVNVAALSIICDDLCDAHTYVQPTVVMKEELFRHLSCGMNLRARIQIS